MFFTKKPAALGSGLFRKRGLERREVEKRIYGGERWRLTASAAFLSTRIRPGFEQPVTKMKTKFDMFVNILPVGVCHARHHNMLCVTKNRAGNCTFFCGENPLSPERNCDIISVTDDFCEENP